MRALVHGAALRYVRGAAEPVWTHGVPNFVQLTDDFARCGQPTREGFEWLSYLGYRISIKLNMEYEGSDDYAKYLGWTVLPFGMNLWEQLVSGPSEQKIHDIVCVSHCLKVKRIIHCEKGEDRTGLGVMFDRMADGWTWEDAMKEALQRGLHKAMWGLMRFARNHRLAV